EPSASLTRRVVPTTSIEGAGPRSGCERAVEVPATSGAARKAARRPNQRMSRAHEDMRPAYTFMRKYASRLAGKLDSDHPEPLAIECRRLVVAFGAAKGPAVGSDAGQGQAGNPLGAAAFGPFDG